MNNTSSSSSSSSSSSMRLSLHMQAIAAELDKLLEVVSGERLAFVLLVSADHTAHYVSNCEREDGEALVEALLERWKAGGVDHDDNPPEQLQ